MPLLHRKEYKLSEPPGDLDDDEEVFICETTSEIFRDYEDYYRKTILYNSLVWSCSVTDRPSMTYNEALGCEKAAFKKLRKIPRELRRPIFFLVKLVQRSKIDHLNDLIYGWIKDRYFVGENVEVTVGKIRRSDCKIIKVQPSQSVGNGHAKESSSDEEKPLANSVPVNPRNIEYVIQYGTSDNLIQKTVASSCIRRLHGVIDRPLCRLLLKAHCYKPAGAYIQGLYQIKCKVIDDYNLGDSKWSDFFVGPIKHFGPDPPKPGLLAKKAAASDKSTSKNNVRDSDDEDDGKKTKKRKSTTTTLTTDDDKRKDDKKKMADEMQRQAEKERKKMEREKEIIQQKKEKLLLRQQKAEEKRQQQERHREWAKPRDDLICDDLKDLPEAHEINLPIPPQCFGDVMQLLEFFQVFGKHFGISHHIPQKVDCDLILEALLSYDHNSPLCELFFFFLTQLLSSEAQDPEGFEKINVEPNDRELASKLAEDNDVTEDILMSFSTMAASWSQTYQSRSLNQLELDSYTLTEILRLYLLSSARRVKPDIKLWRFQQLGGYQFYDDTPLKLVMEQPELIKKLENSSVYDLHVEEKLTLLICLMHQFLSNHASRDLLDDTFDQLIHSKTNLREETFAEKRRQKEAVNERTKLKADLMKGEKNEGPNNEKEMKEEKNTEDEEMKIDDEIVDGNDKKTLEEFDQEENEAKESWEERNKKYQIEISRYQCFYRTAIIGKDRYHRRYWTLNWCPGILVEEFEDDTLVDLLNPTTTSNGETPGLKPSHEILQGKRSKWYVYRTIDEVEILMSSLNCRGFRESKLLENLKNMKHEITRRLEHGKRNKIDFDNIWSQPPAPSNGQRSIYQRPKEQCCIIEFLREHILEFEEKIYNGSLGVVKVSDRKKWRQLISEGQLSSTKLSLVDEESIPDPTSHQSFRHSDPSIKCLLKFPQQKEENTKNNKTIEEQVKDLAKALLAVERGIERKYIQHPLGVGVTSQPKRTNNKMTSQSDDNAADEEEDNKTKQARKQLHRWEASLIQCTSVSQIFVHLNTLQSCIMWSRSVTNAKCRICRRKGDAETMLLCDMCDRGHHMECLDPPLKNVPVGDWFCSLCKPGFKPKFKRTKTKPQQIKKIEEEVEENNSSDVTMTTDDVDNRPPTSSSRKRNQQQQVDDVTTKRRRHKRSATAPQAPPTAKIRKTTTNTPSSGGSKSSKTRKSEGSAPTTTNNQTTTSSTTSRMSYRQRMATVTKEIKLCTEVVNDLLRHQVAYYFAQPVDKNEVPDYYTIITNPMDLQTIKRNISKSHYETPGEILSDIHLIFDNCLYYNEPRSHVHQCAIELREYFIKLSNEKQLDHLHADKLTTKKNKSSNCK